jgi:ATP-binding cassette subfamily C protein
MPSSLGLLNRIKPLNASPASPEHGYTWRCLLAMALRHRRKLLLANLIAVLAALVSVPVPLMMPLLVDEVLLEKPGIAVATINFFFPAAWHGPVLYILFMLLFTVTLRMTSLLLGVWQMRQFTGIAKDVIFRVRRELLTRLQRVSMAEYETVGSGAVASHFVTDLDTVDEFVGTTISKFLVAVLSIVGTAIILLLIHWPLGLFLLLLNPAVIYFTMLLGKRIKHLKHRENTAYETFQGALTETLDAIQQIRAANRERHYLAQLTDMARGVRDQSATFAWRSEAANRLSFLTFLCGFEVFRAIAMMMVVFSDLSIGLMFAVFGYLWFMMGPVQEVLNIQYAFAGAKAALGRVNRLLELKPEPIYPHRRNPFAGKLTTAV